MSWLEMFHCMDFIDDYIVVEKCLLGVKLLSEGETFKKKERGSSISN